MADKTPESGKNDKLENARTEYIAAQDAYIHLDNFTWHVGSVLIAGVFVYWGFIISNNTPILTVLVGNLLVCLLMSIWILYAEEVRQIYRFKLHRIHELEFMMGMCQHRGFDKWPNEKIIYNRKEPKGHRLDNLIYIIVSLGGLLPSLINKMGSECKLNLLYVSLICLNILIVVLVYKRVLYVEDNLNKRILELKAEFFKSKSSQKLSGL